MKNENIDINNRRFYIEYSNNLNRWFYNVTIWELFDNAGACFFGKLIVNDRKTVLEYIESETMETK